MAAVDHTYETIAVELPGHGVARATLPATAPSDAKTIFAMIAARKADVRSAVEVLAKLDKTVLSGAVDLTRIGVFGHSLGGLTSAHVLAGRNSRFTCGVDLDGSVYGIHTNVRQPFLIFTERPRASTIGRFWNILLGERHWFVLNGSKHLNFSDWTWLYPQIRPRGRPSPVANLLGRIGGERALVIERAYVEGFFSSCLRGERSRLLDGSSRPYPEVKQARQPRR